jgi:hypothetical protein
MASGTIVGEKKTGSSSIRLGNSYNMVFSDTYEFLVMANSKETSRAQILMDTPGLPIVGFTVLENGAICKSKQASRREEHPLYWDVVCEFDSEIDSQQQDPNSGNPNDPTTWIPIGSLEIESYTEEKVKDANGDPIVNSAGTPFDYAVQVTKNIVGIRFWQYENDSIEFVGELSQRSSKVNIFAFNGFPPGHLLLEVEEADFGIYYGRKCWKIQYKLKYKGDAWSREYLDIGPFYKPNANANPGDLLPFKTADGSRYIGKLESDGTKRSDLLPALTIETSDYYPKDFNQFLRIKP